MVIILLSIRVVVRYTSKNMKIRRGGQIWGSVLRWLKMTKKRKKVKSGVFGHLLILASHGFSKVPGLHKVFGDKLEAAERSYPKIAVFR